MNPVGVNRISAIAMDKAQPSKDSGTNDPESFRMKSHSPIENKHQVQQSNQT